MTAGLKRSTEEVEKAKINILELLASTCEGNFGNACKAAQIGVSEAYTWRAQDEEFDKAVLLARKIYLHDTLDVAESKSRELLTLGDGAHIRWFLDRQGRERGYISQQKSILEGGDKPVGIDGDFTLTFGTEENDAMGDKPSENSTDPGAPA